MHGILYHTLRSPVISDDIYDARVSELNDLKSSHPEIAASINYSYDEALKLARFILSEDRRKDIKPKMPSRVQHQTVAVETTDYGSFFAA